MKRHLQYLEQAAREVHLREDEKAFIKQRLDVYMQEHPVREHRSVRQRMYLFITTHPMPIAIFALALLLGGGTSVAAAQSLPGDILYPVKTEINEPVRGWFYLDAEAKAEFEAWLAERRNDELARLETRAEAGLSSDERRERALEARTRAEALFETHVDRLNLLADRLEEEGRTEAAARIDASLNHVLDVHADIRARLEAQSDVEDEDMDAGDEADDEETTEDDENGEGRGILNRPIDVQNRDTIRLKLRELFRMDNTDETSGSTDADTDVEADTDAGIETDVETDEKLEVDIDTNNDVEANVDINVTTSSGLNL